MNGAVRPLEGIKVVEFSHMVLGPSCGLILADLGADVVKVEPALEGDKTRLLPGSGSGFFGAFNRNKRSVTVNLKSPELPLSIIDSMGRVEPPVGVQARPRTTPGNSKRLYASSGYSGCPKKS